jgi:hypothetical protein
LAHADLKQAELERAEQISKELPARPIQNY